MSRKEKLIIDVRTREEFVQDHIEGALNIPVHDLEFFLDFLQNKQIFVYCNSGVRANLAKKRLAKDHVNVELLAGDWFADYPRIRRSIISAVNYLEIHPDKEDEFQNHIKALCQKTNEINGFLGSKLLKISGVSGIGGFLPADLSRIDVIPHKYIIITYWKDKQSHDNSHKLKFFKEIYTKLPSYSTQMPYEEFYEILK
jgi:rhodanese-related sulfurtransferase/quinol monooxygenase YgiN